jgi:hypothetical protein
VKKKKGASLMTDLASGITNGAYIMKITKEKPHKAIIIKTNT